MPLYDYECLNCGHQFEVRQHFDEQAVAACPECSFKARRLFHSVPILFKGSGFYSTDYKSGSTNYSSDGKKDEGGKSTEKVAAKSGSGEKAKSEGKSSSESKSSNEGSSSTGDTSSS